MKKYLALLLSLAFAVCLSACDRLPGSVGDLLDSTGDPAGSANTDSGVGYSEDGYASGYMGDTMHTAFFDFTVDSAYTTQEFDGLTAAGEGMSYLTEYYDRPAPADGCKFLVVEITLHNTTTMSQPMFVADFQVQWDLQEGEDEDQNYAFPLYQSQANESGDYVYYSLSEMQLPAEYDLGINEERTGILLYAVPAGAKDYAVFFEEYFSDDTIGDLFQVSFNAEENAG